MQKKKAKLNGRFECNMCSKMKGTKKGVKNGVKLGIPWRQWEKTKIAARSRKIKLSTRRKQKTAKL